MILDKQNRFRILHIITGGGLGGAQSHLYHLARESRRNYEVHVAMGSRGHLWDRLTKEKFPVYHLSSLVRNIDPRRDLVCLRDLTGLIKTIKPHLVCTHSSKAGLLGRLAARLCGAPAVFTAHGWSFANSRHKTKKQLYVFLERLAARLSRRIICVSHYDRNLALKCGIATGDRLVTVHNGLPDLPGKEYLASPGAGNPVRLLMVARFQAPKDYPLLIKALGSLPAGENFEADLAGDGPLLEECKQRAYRSGLGNKVNFLGARTDVPELLARAQIFVLVSRWEGFPVSILEAMRAGLPVVASDVGGIKEAVTHGQTGILIPPGNEQRLREGLLALMGDPGLRVEMGKEGRERFLQHFTLEKMFAKTAGVYARVLPGGCHVRPEKMRGESNGKQ